MNCGDNQPVSIDHYENFPVASWLCPKELRPAVLSLYRFARVGDDLADEGIVSATQRRTDLEAYREDLRRVFTGKPASARWLEVFAPLAQQVRAHQLPEGPLQDLISAFLQDVANPRYPDRAALLDYCSRSANPVGRLLLHLYGAGTAQDLEQSDCICTALQLINFWQDLSVDLEKGRVYLPEQDMRHFDVPTDPRGAIEDGPQLRSLVQSLCQWSRELMETGAPLAWRLPGRLGWELRLVVQGGLRVLEKIEHMQYATRHQRPVLHRWDLGVMAYRAWKMHRSARTRAMTRIG